MLSGIAARLRDLLARRSAERELDEELRYHLERQAEAYIADGHEPAAARRRANAEFGGLEAVREECRQARSTWAAETVLQDARYGLRVMRRNPAFALTAALTLGLTIGALSTVLTLAHTFYLQRLPVPRAHEVVELSPTRADPTATVSAVDEQPVRLGFVSYPDYLHFRNTTRTLTDLAAVYPSAPLFVTAGDQARQVNGAVVSANFLPMLGIEPALGRFFGIDEDTVPDRDRVAVLGHAFWSTWFAAAPDVLGATLHINGVPFTVIGVAPAHFQGITAQPAQIYLPTMMLGVGYRWCDVLEDPDCTILRMLGRLAAGSGLQEARAEASTIVPGRWSTAEPGDNSGATVLSTRGTEPGGTDTRFLRLLTIVSGVLFLVCCANLAGLLSARGSARVHELAIRTSLGASRARVVRQLVTEATILALTGGVLGVGLSAALTRSLGAVFYSTDGSGRPLHFDFELAPVVVLVTVLLSLLAGLLFGAAPALVSVRRGAAAGLRQTRSAAAGWSGSSRLLLGAQAALAVALVVVAALLASSARELVTGANYDPSHVALLRLRPRLLGYGPEQAQRYLRGVMDGLAGLPGVRSASMVGTGVALAGFRAEVAAAGPESQALAAGYIEIGPRYFETIGTPLRRGREFTRQDDTDSAAVAIVSEALAQRLWPGASAVGSVVRINDTDRTVVGVVADIPLQSRAESPRPYVYVPFWQNPEHIDARLQVRVDGDPAAMIPSLVRAIRAIDPDVPVTETVTLPQRMAGRFRPLRMSAAAVIYAGALAVVLTALGLYAALAAAVQRRTREIGASSAGTLAMIAREGMTTVLAGVAVGLALALAGSRLLQHLLYGTDSGDVVLYAAAGLLVALVGLVACWFPARRAARIEPMAALRVE